ncbi:MAG: 4Fe-4S dicluster domain-containing protein [Pseudomonadota bacterium]
MTTDIFRRLQERLDLYSLGFPATESGIELTLLRELFTQEDAGMFLNLTPMPETPGAVAGRLQRPEADVACQLEAMAGQGLLFRLKKGDGVRYSAIPFVHGLFEFQVKRLGKPLADLVETYFHSGFYKAMAENARGFLRTVPVQASIDTSQRIAAYDDACALLGNQRLIVVTDCICRIQKNLVNKGCGKDLETCFMFGSMAQYYLDHNMGRQVDMDEAVAILKKARDAGLVTQPATAQNPGGMCNCCGDCCGVLSSLKPYPRPAEMVFSNYVAANDTDACVGCGTCLDRCQMDAITQDSLEKAIVLSHRCIGCGLCVTTCPAGSMTLAPKPQDLQQVPPATGLDQMMAMARNRGIQF